MGKCWKELGYFLCQYLVSLLVAVRINLYFHCVKQVNFCLVTMPWSYRFFLEGKVYLNSSVTWVGNYSN